VKANTVKAHYNYLSENCSGQHLEFPSYIIKKQSNFKYD